MAVSTVQPLRSFVMLGISQTGPAFGSEGWRAGGTRPIGSGGEYVRKRRGGALSAALLEMPLEAVAAVAAVAAVVVAAVAAVGSGP